MDSRTYIAIDLKSFYASVECVDRHVDPLTTNLVVADATRTEKTICLAVSPALKSWGVPGRPRLFEVVEKVKGINAQRLFQAHSRFFHGKSVVTPELKANPLLELDYLVACPRMARYMEVSSRIYGIYLRYISPDDIHVYSIDEVFIDATQYLRMYSLDARAFAMKLIREVLRETGITATAGIGSNLYLAKIAMDIVAKHIPADKDGVRIAELDEMEYRRQLWSHQPLTDFWRVGAGYMDKLHLLGLRTMGDIARLSIMDEDILYKTFGINAELLIDHAWGWEPCTIAHIKSYKPQSSSLGSGQVLHQPYTFQQARNVVREMTDLLALDLFEKHLVTDQMVLTVGYDVENSLFKGTFTTDRYGRNIPHEAHGSINLNGQTSSARIIMNAVTGLYDRIVQKNLLVRRLYVVANHTVDESQATTSPRAPEQLDLFTDYKALAKEKAAREEELAREKRQQEAILHIRKTLGKNAILKGMNLEDGATTRDRNQQIGGHKM